MWSSIRERLSLCHGTLINVSPPEFVTAAAAARFNYVSLRVISPKSNLPGKVMGDYPLSGNTPLRQQTRERLDDTGVKVVEAEAAVIGPDTSVDVLEPYIESAAVLGAVGVIPVFFGQSSEQQIIDQFSEFANLAAGHGQLALIEFIALSAIKTIKAASNVIVKSGVTNGRIIVDSLHWTRSGGTPEDIRYTDPALIHGAQINDGKIDFPDEGPNWWEEMSGKRSFLGEGDFKVNEMLEALPSGIPIGFEVISREFQERGLSPSEMANYAMQNAQTYFANS